MPWAIFLAGWLLLDRPPGWEDRLAELLDDAGREADQAGTVDDVARLTRELARAIEERDVQTGMEGEASWRKCFEADVLGAVRGVEAAMPFLEKSGEASVVFIGTTASVETFMAPMAYNALKASLITYAKQLSQHVGTKNIRVNVVSPGPIKFPGGAWDQIEQGMPDLYNAHVAMQPNGRLGEPEEPAEHRHREDLVVHDEADRPRARRHQQHRVDEADVVADQDNRAVHGDLLVADDAQAVSRRSFDPIRLAVAAGNRNYLDRDEERVGLLGGRRCPFDFSCGESDGCDVAVDVEFDPHSAEADERETAKKE